ncbi:MAG: hypothetical protein MMC33_006046 [Icmadophila ericetorum]|nr:hypothetical protein [Icmadophila ericetorum]
MSGAANVTSTAVPAQLSFLAIYNPSLGNTDEAIYDQVVYFYSSKANKARRRTAATVSGSGESSEERNERLRQIGLAQGMVDFAKAFSNGEAVDTVESEKSRILLHELETGWWILASIDLTQLRSLPHSASASASASVEYSAREVCPQSLLLQHLLRAHTIFLLHHAPSLADLFVKLPRSRFCGTLERFWDRYIRSWDILLNGNPAVDIYNGLKLAVGGELGIGVGEEEWGSGEREVLEGFIERTEGLVDLIVSRFGDEPQEDKMKVKGSTHHVESGSHTTWLGSGRHPQSSDGVIFSGVGAITRSSAKNVSAWMEWIYRYGKNAYGVENNPHTAPRKRRRKLSYSGSEPKQEIQQGATAKGNSNEDERSPKHFPEGESPILLDTSPPGPYSGIPPPIVTAKSATRPGLAQKTGKISRSGSLYPLSDQDSATGAETLIKYLTLGVYGSSWGIPSRKTHSYRRVTDLRGQHSSSTKDSKSSNEHIPQAKEPTAIQSAPAQKKISNRKDNRGYFLIGLQGDLDDDDIADDESDGDETGTDADRQARSELKGWNKRTLLRTLHVERTKSKHIGSSEDQADGPLQQPLLSSTSPKQVSERLIDATYAKSTATTDNNQPIYDLVYDPSNLTVHTTIPNIAEPGTAAAEGIGSKEEAWTRIEALNVHSQILNTHTSTRRYTSELERTSKTKRGWWVVWMRLPNASFTPFSYTPSNYHREAILIRKASDYTTPNKISSKLYSSSSASTTSGWGAGKLAEGIGIDTRRYIESILSLNR